MKKILFVLLMALTFIGVKAQGYNYDPDTVYTVHSIDQQRFM